MAIRLAPHPVDIRVMEKLDPDMPEHAGFKRFYTFELALVGITEEIDPRHRCTAVVVPGPDAFVFGVVCHNDVPSTDRGIDESLVFTNEVISITDGIVTDINPPHIGLVGQPIIEMGHVVHHRFGLVVLPDNSRCKGIVHAAEYPSHRVVLQAVGRRSDISLEDEWGDRQPRTQIVAIGAPGSIDETQLTSMFASCVQEADKN